MISEQQILDALKGVVDPGHGSDIVSLGRVSEIVIKDGNIGFAIEVEPERGSELEPLRKAAEDEVMKLDGVTSATVVLTAERPSHPAKPAPAASAGPTHSAAAGASEKMLLPDVGAIIAVASGKGAPV